MHNDDQTTGEILNRRDALRLIGAGGALFLAGCGSTSSRGSGPEAASQPAVCVVRPAQTEGPFFVDERLKRSDIRTDPSDGTWCAGLPLELTLFVARISNGHCSAMADAQVDLWHCDARGFYSDVGNAEGSMRGKKFLRGYQLSDRTGMVRFLTVYPGWYAGRTVHIHFKIRLPGDPAKNYSFTSQLYFDDRLTRQVYARNPYALRGPPPGVNADDGIYREGGDQLLLPAALAGQSCQASFGIGLTID